MKWVAISGSWRATTKKTERDVRDNVRKIIASGNSIVSGGALNVDYFATDEALKLDPTCKRIKIFLPATLTRYARHYRKRAREGVITKQQAEELITQLTKIKKTNPRALIENKKNTIIDTEAYYERNSAEIDAADELIAFLADISRGGTQDTIAKAKKRGIPFKVYRYRIQS
jgi:predicted AlkP superfamily phosphohydrolase/phosphomutase